MNDQDVINDFLVESYENLDQLDRDLVALEHDPSSSSTLASIFRTIHTIKGTCGFLGFNKLESVTHVGENLLSRLRDGELVLSCDITSGLLGLVDAVRQMLANIETTTSEGTTDYSELVASLIALQEAALSTAETGSMAPAEEAQTPAEAAGAEEAKVRVEEAVVETSVEASFSKPEQTPVPPASQDASDEESRESSAASGSAADGRNTALSDSTIRVDVGLLDKLMNLVGELVLARNQILQFTGTQEDSALISTSQRLNLITTELQEGVMKTRMQPIGNIWSKFPRVVRDLALTCGKEVRLEMEGKDTELDKTIIEAIKDPLTHLVRNSVDHGIESPELRAANGKPAEGRLFLRAFHEGGQVNIEISDDGAGIDSERIAKKAVERGLISAEQAARYSEREILNLIFLPGFSTAAQVTNVSGRGVGMDVVKTNIEKIGGTVDLQSTRGDGTTVKIKIPLTLAIIPALVVTSRGDRYAIPQISLLELVRLEGEQARTGIELINGTPVYRLRGQLLPLVYLNHELGLDGEAAKQGSEPPEHGDTHDLVNIVVLRADDRQFGLVVDEINDTEEIVVKPMGKQLKKLSMFAGATIMGDGRVALILDVLGIAQNGRVVTESRERKLDRSAKGSQDTTGSWQTLLLVGVGRDGRVAIPLSMVARLEEFPLSEVERSMDQEVVQYRGQILPLVRIARILELQERPASDAAVQVVVCTAEGRTIGLVVDHIIDIVETMMESSRTGKRPGLLGSAIIQHKVTDLLDVQSVICASESALNNTLPGEGELANVR